MDSTKEFACRFANRYQPLAVLVLQQIRFLHVAALDRLATGMTCYHQQIFIAIKIQVPERCPPSNHGLAQGHEPRGTRTEREVLLALIEVQLAVFILIVGNQQVGFQIAVEVAECQAHAAIDDRTGPQSGPGLSSDLFKI